MADAPKYHIGFSQSDLGADPPLCVLLCGDPDRIRKIAGGFPGIKQVRLLSEKRGLVSFFASTEQGMPLLLATSGMGAPSMSIVVNELYQVGIRLIIRVGTTGSIQEALVKAARELGVDWHLGITASVDTFFEGQGRTLTSANTHLLRRLQGITEEYAHLNILNYEMECGTLFKMAGVYGFAAGCVCAVIDDRTTGEAVDLSVKDKAESDAIRVALAAIEGLDPECLGSRR
ncbi:MAG: uridine phosphorylase [Desulfomonilia bacterium]